MSLEFEESNETSSSTLNEETAGDSSQEQQEPIVDTFSGCESCGSLAVEEGYALKLCKECRDRFSKRPIPMQIKLVTILLGIIIIFSLAKFPSTIRIGVEYERGLRAEKASKYSTAIKHYENVVKEYPESDKAMVRLYVSYYKSEEINKAYEIFDKIAGPSPSNKKMKKELVDEVNETTRKLDTYYNPSKELYDKLQGMQNPKTQDIINVVKPFADKGPNEVFAAYYLADLYFDINNYNEASVVLSKVIAKNPDFYSGYLLQAAAFRELGKYDEAVGNCNKVLQHNVEDAGAYISLSKIELKRRNNEKGLEYAKKAYELEPEDFGIIANLALAYHYNNSPNERDKYYKMYQDSERRDKYTDDLLKSIFNGTLQWQNQI